MSGEFGWRAKGDRKLGPLRHPYIPVPFQMLLDCLPFLYRYMFYWVKHVRRNCDELFIDTFRPLELNPNYGVPCGSLGSGSIGRDFRGGFCKFSLRPGLVEHSVTIVPANQFILTVTKNGSVVYQQALCAAPVPNSEVADWAFEFPPENVNYRGLFPRSWTEYSVPEHQLKLTCRQVSPVLPNEYKDSSLPVSVFVWDVDNLGTEEVGVSLTFTWRNGTGDIRWKDEGTCYDSMFQLPSADVNDNVENELHEEPKDMNVFGMSLDHSIDGMRCVYSVATKQNVGQHVSRRSFNPKGSGKDVWRDLVDDGQLNETVSTESKELGIAVCSRVSLKPKSQQKIEFSLVWDMPVVQFSGKHRIYKRKYSKWYGCDCTAGARISGYALKCYGNWERAIEEWQSPVLEHQSLPSWYKSAIFNELYFLVDGGSVWFEYDPCWPKEETHLTPYAVELMKENGRFGYLESWEYRMLNTYDVHFYASFALAMLWPKLEHTLQAEFANQVNCSDERIFNYFYDGQRAPVKTPMRVPHDLGNPACEPWLLTNAYRMHNTGDWRDLNLKFVLVCYRDFRHVVEPDKRNDFLNAVWPSIKALMEIGINEWDEDGDGMIENSGSCDQTYDAWKMKGTSAYCGGLWIGALSATIRMAEALDESETVKKYSEILERAHEAYEKKLWTGTYYRFDDGNANSDTIMADQLCGHWFLCACDGTASADILPKDHVEIALRTIFKYNVMGFSNGEMGAVNGVKPNGDRDLVCIQSEEMWTGVTYALAGYMIHQGLVAEGFKTAEGCYKSCFERLGLQYQTPEALYEKNCYRAVGYLRPLSIWSIQWVLEKFYGFPDLPNNLFPVVAKNKNE